MKSLSVLTSRVPATALLWLASSATLGCSDSAVEATEALPQSVVRNYAALVAQNYEDTLAGARALRDAVHAFTDAPSATSLARAREAWLEARHPYALSEAYRFYQGPIDNDDSDDDVPEGPEPLINSWPLDESYIDYVVTSNGSSSNSGIINAPDQFPSLNAKVLSDANTQFGETSISTGYHAIEFLLWGQDLSPNGPGDRPYTDYVSGPRGTAENQDRRAEYLLTLTDLLVDQLANVNDAWRDGASNYRAGFVALAPREALGKILLGVGNLSGAELSGDRMKVAYDNQDQEDEHSCFSDNTLNDLHDNATAIEDVLLGRYGDAEGPGVADLVEAQSPELAQKLRQQIHEAIRNIDAVPPPFDQAILGDDDTPARQHLLAAIRGLQGFTETLVEAARALDIDLKFEE